MTVFGLTSQEFWTAVIPICVVGLIYFGGEAIRDEFKISNEKPWRWGDEHRRASKEPTWASHFALAPATLLLVIFAIGLLRRL